MTTPSRLRLIAYPFELVKGDRVVPDAQHTDGGLVASTETNDEDRTTTVVFEDESTATMPSTTILDVDRVTELVIPDGTIDPAASA